MPKNIVQYSVFIGSPGGLNDERQKFREILEKCSLYYGSDKGVRFHPVGWEDTTGGAGRPQNLINEDLKQCDFAVFVLHDRWGSPTGSGHTSGTEEEWELAEELYKANKIRNIALLFKAVDPVRLADPGDQLKAVLAFKKKIEAEKRYLFREYATIERFSHAVEGHLAAWLKEHDKAETELSSSGPSVTSLTAAISAIVPPSFEYWIAEAVRNNGDNVKEYNAAMFCASKAIECSRSDIEWAQAKNIWGVIHSKLTNFDESISAFTEIADKFSKSIDADRRAWHAKVLVNKGIALGAFGRSEEAIAIYDDVVAHFGAAPELPLREQVAKALVNKGVTLGGLGRSDEAIAIYDDVVARFGAAPELPLREPVAKALFNKGVRLGAFGRSEEAIAVYDDVVARFGAAPELPLREQVAKALFNKGRRLDALGRSEEAIAVYDEVLARFGSATESSLLEQVERAKRLKRNLEKS
ncbi:tetratricopeptide repeat protein [Azorhizobium caulinodans]|uniref:tetratricopeptide repeat protein n=1 Tax=Azorhizobium caulinodans TaxID=7 RepID=UPI002FBE3A66